jgi:DNA-binding transcriptional LysR family regulator
MIKYQQIIYALALLRHGKFRRAADAENISQPAFSRSIANLEDSLGVKLFNRQRGQVTPTPYGELFKKHSELILEATHELERDIILFKELGAGELSVAFAPYPAELSGHRAIGKLISEHPKIRCKVTSSDWYEVEKLVVERKADLGFSELSEAVNNDKLETEVIGQHQFVFFCRTGHPLLKKRRVTKKDFFNYPLVLIKLPIRIAPHFPGELFPEKDTSNMLPSIEIQDLYQSRQIISESNAFSAAAPFQIRRELESGEFSIIRFYEPWMTLKYGFMRERGRMLSPAASKFMTLVKEIELQVSIENKKLVEKFIAGR